VRFVALPLADVLIPVFVFPKTITLHRTVLKVSNVVLVPKFQ
jgi:hypothetical protein